MLTDLIGAITTKSTKAGQSKCVKQGHNGWRVGVFERGERRFRRRDGGHLVLSWYPGRGEALAPPVDGHSSAAPVRSEEVRDGDRARIRIQERGLAWNRDEWIAGLSVVAGAVYMGDRLVGALALALPSPALAERDAQELEQQVKAAAEEASSRLSGLGRVPGSAWPPAADSR